MIWEVSDNICNKIKIEDKKIVKTFNGWHIISVTYPDNKKGREMDFLTITIKRDNDKEN